jgi:hypothetical protein
MKRSKLPDIVETLMVFHNCWLVGSGAEWFMAENDDMQKPSDWDLISEQNEFAAATKRVDQIAQSVCINSMGGLKFRTGECWIDIWTDTMAGYTKIAEKTKEGTIRAVRLNPRIELKDLS